MSTPSKENETELREKLAVIEHERWADWQKWCHKILREQLPSEYLPELNKVLARWEIQIATPYKYLSKAEQKSDMEQVDRYWKLITADKQQAFRNGQLDCQKAGRVDNHVAYKETLRELLQELMEHKKKLGHPDNCTHCGGAAVTEVIPLSVIQNKLEGLS